jgi:hypothetical protein
MTAGVGPHRVDDYPLWSPHTVEVIQSVLAYTLLAVFAAIAAVYPDGRHPRVIYGCQLNPCNTEDAENDNGNIPGAIETQARLSGATYYLQLRDTVRLTSNATVSPWSAVAIGAAHNGPTVIAILGRVGVRNTPPRVVMETSRVRSSSKLELRARADSNVHIFGLERSSSSLEISRKKEVPPVAAAVTGRRKVLKDTGCKY